MPEPFIRLFCHVTEAGEPLGDLGYACVRVLDATGLAVRVIPCRPVSYGADGRWDKYSRLLVTEVPEDFVNAVCGDANDLRRFHTTGRLNLALVEDDAKVELPYVVLRCSNLLALV